jgi:DNA gyrase/topoisomerase IV subunit A
VGLQENFKQIPLKDFAEKAYLDYSMYVILNRAFATRQSQASVMFSASS